MNSEAPIILREPGYLTEEEHQANRYFHCKSGMKVKVRVDGGRVDTTEFMDERYVKDQPKAHAATKELRELILRRDEERFPEESRFERLLVGKKLKPNVGEKG